jgi:putative peptide zinc metalloprotease protein
VLGGRSVPLELVLLDGTRVPIVDTVTIGRGAGNTIQLAERTVSRRHARIVVDGDVPSLEDAGSRYGTFLDEKQVYGREPLRDGARIGVGDIELVVEAHRPETAPGRTVVVPVGVSLLVPAVGPSEIAAATADYGMYPRVRSGWALKRLEAGEGERRYVIRNLRDGRFARMAADDVELFRLIDGEHSLQDLIVEATGRFGPAGASRLASLLADLGERELLEGVEASDAPVPAGPLRRLLRPKTWVVPGAGEAFERIYRAGGFVLFARPVRVLVVLVAVGGGGTFAYLIGSRQVTPFVVASRVGVGGLVFLLGRFLVVLLHELAHGLTVASFGRRVPRAGLKLVLVFPYAFVDTSEAWFEPSRRRLAISAAGPISDVTVGGAAALVCFGLSDGVPREVVFQLALAAYMGAFFNLNPLLERDGYHILVDVLHEPGLRRRSQAWLAATLRREPQRRRGDASVLGGYAAAAFAWSLITVAFTVVISLRYYEELVALAPRGVVWALFAVLYAVVLLPIVIVVKPAFARRTPASPGQVDVLT